MSIDELVVAVKELQAQRRQDQSTWPELAGILDEYAQRIEGLEHQDMQYNDRISLVAENCRAVTKNLEHTLHAQMNGYTTDAKNGLLMLEEKAKQSEDSFNKLIEAMKE